MQKGKNIYKSKHLLHVKISIYIYIFKNNKEKHLYISKKTHIDIYISKHQYLYLCCTQVVIDTRFDSLKRSQWNPQRFLQNNIAAQGSPQDSVVGGWCDLGATSFRVWTPIWIRNPRGINPFPIQRGSSRAESTCEWENRFARCLTFAVILFLFLVYQRVVFCALTRPGLCAPAS